MRVLRPTVLCLVRARPCARQRMAMELASHLASGVGSEEDAAMLLEVVDTLMAGLTSRDQTVTEHAVTCVSRLVSTHAGRAVGVSRGSAPPSERWHLQLLEHLAAHGVVPHLLRLLRGACSCARPMRARRGAWWSSRGCGGG